MAAIITLLRPRQWIKNIITLSAPLAAGRILEPKVALSALLTFVVFSLASSAVYCINDVFDADADAAHPRKRTRPVASGAVRRSTALGLGIVLAVASLLASLPNNDLWVVIVVYLGVNVAYSAGLKHVAVLELCIVASGFLLRAIGGGPASGIPLSQWFLIVTAFGSLFMVAGKRLAELIDAGDGPALSRPILGDYQPSYLRAIATLSAGITLTAYSLWAFEMAATHVGVNWAAISIAPLVVALLRYLLDVDHGRAEEPEQLVLSDPILLTMAASWIVLFVLEVAGAR